MIVYKKISLFYVLIFFCFSKSFSQIKEEVQIEQTKNGQTETYHKIMLIPYDPNFYLSDAEQEIIEATKKDPKQVRESFRRTIDLYIQHGFSRLRPCISLLNDADSIPSLQEALINIYSKTGYRYGNPMPLPYKPETNDSLSKQNKKAVKETFDSRTAQQYITFKGDAKYMNAVISKPEVLEELFKEYGTDIFVFINQFEIKTNYNSCLNIANKIYKREIMLHFSVFEKNGKQIAGAYATTFFPSDSNNAFDIMKNCFPELARFVRMCVP